MSQIEDKVRYMQNFVEECIQGDITKYTDDSDPVNAIKISKELRRRYRKEIQDTEINQFKFVIISNNTLSKQVKNLRTDDFLERPMSIEVWTIERFYESFISDANEIIEINTKDYDCEGIPVLKANIGDNVDYDAYLGIIPGKFLGKIYINFTGKLLQGNVRAFLSERGAVNKGIRQTITNHPEQFFTYNNGIAIVARSIKLSPDGTKVVYLKDPQIINGGQTTASIANAIIKKTLKDQEHGLDNLYVPLKLTVLNVGDDMDVDEETHYETMTQKISEYANSQNAVNPADFFSNHPFHKQMEKLSRSVLAPMKSGETIHTHWYYERSRGKWEQEQIKLTPAEQKRYVAQWPKKQIIKKELLAKCMNSIENPHEVCQSSAINFKHFAIKIEEEYDKAQYKFNEEYYKNAVCSVIMFSELDNMIAVASWYPRGGDKAQIIPYTIAKLMYELPKDKTIDWPRIWKNQTLYGDLRHELLLIAKRTFDFLNKEADGGLVRSLARKKETWTKYKEIPISLSSSFVSSLIDIKEQQAVADSANKEEKGRIALDNALAVFNLGADYWHKVGEELDKRKLIPYGDCEAVKKIATTIRSGNLIDDWRYKQLLKIIKKAEDKGYVFSQK